jgi:hypothetical protein
MHDYLTLKQQAPDVKAESKKITIGLDFVATGLVTSFCYRACVHTIVPFILTH